MKRRDVLKSAAAAAAGFLLPHPGARADQDHTPRLGVRRASERGHANHGWLDTRHTFSFAGYHDPRWMGFRSLRVINEDRVRPGKGFPTHPHRDMEIITYVLEGGLEHKDSTGNGGLIRPGEVQRMSAGTGIRHSEVNPSATEDVHFLQVWIVPDRRGVKPSYDQRTFSERTRTNDLRIVASKDGRDGSIAIHQDVNLRAGILEPNRRLAWSNPRGRHVWLHVAKGRLQVNDTAVGAGDAIWASDPGRLALAATERTEVLLFDLA